MKDPIRATSAAPELPDDPLRPEQPVADVELRAYEVVLARNLDPPYRYSQDYYWLEVLATDEEQAQRIAVEWMLANDTSFEVTDWVRPRTEHYRYLGRGPNGRPLEVRWDLVVDEALRPGTMIRHPATGERIGFVGYPQAEERWLEEGLRGEYRLLQRKPTPGSAPVCLAPLVRNCSPLRIREIEEE